MALEGGWLIGGFTKVLALIVQQVAMGATGIPVSLRDVAEFKMGDEVRDYPPDVVRAISQVGSAVGSPLGFFPTFGQIFGSGMGQIQTMASQKEYETARLSAQDIFTMLFRGIISETELPVWLQDLREQGLSYERIEKLQEIVRPILNLGEIRDLYLRGEFGKGEEATTEAIRRITSIGYSTEDATEIIKLFYYIPPATDMIRMVVREAWRDDVAELFQTDEGYDTLPFSTFEKAGVSAEWLRAYWRSHWELPSMSQAFEMLHRGVIDLETLNTLLKVQDVMPYWRGKITAIAYTPFTRVDVRRMYKLGVLDEFGVFKAYTDIGYRPSVEEHEHKNVAEAFECSVCRTDSNAGLMLQFTKEYVNTDEPTIEDEVKELTRAQVLAGYRELVIDRETATQWLVDLTYPSELAEFFLMLEDIKEAERQVKDELSFIGKAYSIGTMTRETMVDRLGKLNLPSAKSDYYTEKFDRDQVTKAQRPTPADIKAWYKKDLIGNDEFADEMSLEGFSDYYISKYMEQIKG